MTNFKLILHPVFVHDSVKKALKQHPVRSDHSLLTLNILQLLLYFFFTVILPDGTKKNTEASFHKGIAVVQLARTLRFAVCVGDNLRARHGDRLV